MGSEMCIRDRKQINVIQKNYPKTTNNKKAKVVSDAIKDLESGNLDTHVAVSHERFENITKRKSSSQKSTSVKPH